MTYAVLPKTSTLQRHLRFRRYAPFALLLMLGLSVGCVGDAKLKKAQDAQADANNEPNDDDEADGGRDGSVADRDAVATGTGSDGGGIANEAGIADGAVSLTDGGSSMDGGSATDASGADAALDAQAADAAATGDAASDAGHAPAEPNRHTGITGSTGALAYAVSTPQAHAIPGTPLNYVFTVSNTSGTALEGVKATLTVPTGMTISAAYSMPSPSCFNNSCPQNTEAPWTIGTLAGYSSRSITVQATLAGTIPADSTISALVRFEATGINPATLTKLTPVKASAKAEIAVTTPKDLFQAGEVFRYSVDVGQVDNATVLDSKLVLQLPPSVEIGASSHGGTNDGTGQVVWPLADMPVGSTWKRWVDVTVREGTSAGTLLNARASVSSADGSTLHRDGERVVSVISAATTLTMNVSTTLSPVSPSGYSTFVVSLTNPSEQVVNDVRLVLEMPPGVSFSGPNHSEPSASCFNNACINGAKPIWNLGVLPAGASRAISIEMALDAGALTPGRLARFNFELSGTGVVPVRVIKTLPVTVVPQAQLALTSLSRPVVAGESVGFDLDVGQVGNAALQDAVLRLRLPAGLTFASATDGGALDASGEVVWNLGTVAVSGSRHFSVQLTTAANFGVGRNVQAEARLDFAGGRFEQSLTAQQSVRSAQEAPPLTLVLSAMTNPIAHGATEAYSATITNVSTRALNDVSFVIRLPTGLYFHGANGAEPNANCFNNNCGAHLEAPWTIASLGVGASQIITFNPIVAADVVAGSLLTIPMHLTATGVEMPIYVQHTLRVQ